jgi:hypothetical protein
MIGGGAKAKNAQNLRKSRLSAILAHAATISYDKAKNFGELRLG